MSDDYSVTIPRWCAEELERLAADLGWEQLRIELRTAVSRAQQEGEHSG